MNRWQVQLIGEKFDLEELPKLFDRPSALVSEADGGFFLESVDFEIRPSAADVRAHAARIVETMNGAARLANPRYEPVRIGHVYERSPSGKNVHVLLEGAVRIRTKVHAVATVTRADGSRPPDPAPAATNAWLGLALHDEDARLVLSLLGKQPAEWHDLYKVMELLQADGATGLLPKSGLRKSEIVRFARTANSIHAIGLRARHARRSIPAPAKPMSLTEAHELIGRWARAWLESRCP